jgi:hypothetical protein
MDEQGLFKDNLPLKHSKCPWLLLNSQRVNPRKADQILIKSPFNGEITKG